MARRLTVLLMLVILAGTAAQASVVLQTVAEKTNFLSTSTSSEVWAYLNELAGQSKNIRLDKLATTYEGRDIPLVLVADPMPADYKAAMQDKRPVVYIQANIHPGEVCGKEALLMVMRDMLTGDKQDLPKKIIFVIVPNFNPDGNDMISKENRSYVPGPANGVGVRYNSQQLDLNRDYIKLDTQEVRATIEKIYTKWNPLVTFDLHATNGSFHKHTITYLSAIKPFISERISDYTWGKMFPSISESVLKENGVLSLPYGNFIDHQHPEKGWESFPDTPRLCSSYISFRGNFSILVETYAHIDYKTRVMSTYHYLRKGLEFIADHSEEMQAVYKTAVDETIKIPLKEYSQRAKMALKTGIKAGKDITVHTYEVKRQLKAGVYPRYIPQYNKPIEVKIPLLNVFIPIEERTYAAAYILPPGAEKVAEHMKTHGIKVDRITRSIEQNFKEFIINDLKTSATPDQGHWPTVVKGEWKPAHGLIREGSYLVRMDQPLLRLISMMLEPDTSDSLLLWNFFDSWLITQWGRQLLPYPVYRFDEMPEITTVPY